MAGNKESYFITIASPDCSGWPVFAPLQRVRNDVSHIETLFLEQGYAMPLKEKIPVGASSQTIKDELDQWLSSNRKPTDQLVLYITGHGSIDEGGNHFLVTSDSQEGRISKRIETGDLAKLLLNRQKNSFPQSILLLLDVCYAGQGSVDFFSNLKNSNLGELSDGCGCHIITSVGAVTEALDGVFVEALLATMQNEAFMPRGGTTYLSPYALKDALNDYLKNQGESQRAEYAAIASGDQEAMFIRNLRATLDWDGKLLSDQTHWRSKAWGGDDSFSREWFFSGRRQALRDLADWLAQPQSDLKARVVTGAPGSGKSALLGRLMLAAMPEEESKIPADLQEPFSLPDGLKLIGLNATGETQAGLIKTIGQRLGGMADSVDQVMAQLTNEPAPLGIIVDSLDEAIEPGRIADELLYPLAGHPAVRLIVGSRLFGEQVPLTDRARAINLDNPTYFSAADIADYVVARLTRRIPPTVYAPPDQHTNARRLAAYIAREANRSFLYARLVSRSFESADRPVDTSVAGWEKQVMLPADVPAAFGRDLDRFGKADRQRIIEVLLPLAYANGKGLPQKTIWYTIATALAGQSYRNYDLEDVKGQVSYFLIQDTENGETVFRLFHKALADYLRYLSRNQAIGQQFAQVLRQMSGPDWQNVPHEPYLRAWLPAHARAGGELDRWMMEVGFLLAVSPGALMPHLPWLQQPESRRVANAYRVAVQNGPDNAATLSVSDLRWQAIRYGATGLAGQLQSFQGQQHTFARWGMWHLALSSYALASTTELSKSLTTGTDAEGNPIAACGYVGGRVRVWNLNDGAVRLDFLPYLYKIDDQGVAEYPDNIALLPVDSDVLVVVAWSLGTVRVLSLTSGHELGKTDVNQLGGSKVFALQIVNRDGQNIVVITSENTELTGYSLPDLQPINAMYRLVGDKMYSLAEMTYNGQPVLVTSRDSFKRSRDELWHMVELRDLTDLNIVWQSAGTQPSGWVNTLLIASVDTTDWIVALHYFYGVSLFDPATNRQMSLPERFHLSELIDWYVQENTLYLIGLNYGQLRILVLTPAPGNTPDPFDLTLHPNCYSLPKEWGRLVNLRDRPTLVSRSDQGLRIWDLNELLTPADPANELQISPEEVNFVRMTVQWDRIVIISGIQRLRALTADGRLQWIAPILYEAVAMHFLKLNGVDLLAVCLPNRIVFIAADTGHETGSSIPINGKPIDLTVHVIQGQPIAFVAMELIQIEGGGERLYAVRAWNLLTGNAINTKQLYDYGQPWPFQMSALHKRKSLVGVRVLEWQATVLVILADRYGAVRAIEFVSSEEVDSWGVGRAAIPVTAMDVFVLNEYPVVVAGNDEGVLVVRNMASQAYVGHVTLTGYATALCHYQTETETVLVVGTDKGIVSFWTPDLVCLHQIDARYRIHGVAIVSGNQLAIGTSQGIMVVDVNWQQIAQATVPVRV
ncbi:hypothetical protein [Spirosoma areae]